MLTYQYITKQLTTLKTDQQKDYHVYAKTTSQGPQRTQDGTLYKRHQNDPTYSMSSSINEIEDYTSTIEGNNDVTSIQIDLSDNE